MTDPVLSEKRDGVGIVTLNRPEARNAINVAATNRLMEIVDGFEADDAVAVIVMTGAGGTFCSGMDLKGFAAGERPSVPGRGFAGLARVQLQKPFIAAVEGYALAGGCEFALMADIVIAGRTASFGLPEVKRGIVAGAGGVHRLAKTMPYGAAMEMALTGDAISAERAFQLGLVTQLVDEGQALDAALDLARRITANAPLAVRASKALVSASVKWLDLDLFELQNKVSEPLVGSEDAKEGARAFAEKRAPRWQGR